MSPILLLLFVCLTIGLAYVGGAAAYGHFKSGSKTYRADLRNEKTKREMLESTMRKIANDTVGNPALEAQLVLYKIDADTNELES